MAFDQEISAAKPRAALYDLEAEQAVLGVALRDNAVVRDPEGLYDRHFYEPFHQRLWAKMKEQAALGVAFDVLPLNDAFDGDPAYAELGGVRYLADLDDRAPPAANAREYARLIVERHTRRDLMAIAEEIRASTSDPAISVRDVVTEAEKRVVDIARGSEPSEANLIDARTAADETLAEFYAERREGRPKGLMTGLRCFDRRLRGLRPGALIVIAGRPSMAKSGLARQAALGAAMRNPGHLFPFFCLEMARREMTERTLSEITYRMGEGMQYRDMNPEGFNDEDFAVLERAARKVPANFILDDTATLSVEYVRRRVWSLKRKGPVGAIFIDYLQIMQRPHAPGRNDASIIGDMTAGLKRLAREVGCAVVLLSQINRGVESRDDKRPQLSDLRESGSIEQDANAVLFPFREVYYLERSEPKPGTTDHRNWEEQVELLKRRMDVLCAKNRGGAVGSDHQEYFAEYDAITDVKEDAR